MIPERCPGLREQFVGEMEGLSWDEMERRYPGVREAYISDWFHTTPPGGESPEEMARRVGDCVDEIVGRGEDTLLVAHNGSLSLVLAHLGIAGEKELLHPGLVFPAGVLYRPGRDLWQRNAIGVQPVTLGRQRA